MRRRHFYRQSGQSHTTSYSYKIPDLYRPKVALQKEFVCRLLKALLCVKFIVINVCMQCEATTSVLGVKLSDDIVQVFE